MQDRRGSHVAALDGLRGVSIVGVLLVHTLVRKFLGGFLGVDVFFVLSGYLITTLLLRERAATGMVSFRAFYARRALRLYPALVLAVVLFLPVAAQVTIGHTLGNYLTGGGFALAYLTDIPAALHHRYAFGHTWSLAVEEQFYLVWPPVLMVLVRRGRNAALAAALLVAVLSSIANAVFLHPQLHDDPSTYYDPLTHGPGGLLAGSALALWLSVPRHRVPGAALQHGSVLLLAAAVITPWRDDSERLQSLLIPAATLAACGLVAGVLAAPQAPVARALRLWPVVGLGRISYGLYLLHPPIYAVIAPRWHHSRPSLVVFEISVSILAATASYWIVEKPFLRLQSRFRSQDAPPLDVGVALAAPSG